MTKEKELKEQMDLNDWFGWIPRDGLGTYEDIYGDYTWDGSKTSNIITKGISKQLTEEEQFINDKIEIVKEKRNIDEIEIKVEDGHEGNFITKTTRGSFSINLDGTIPLKTGSSHELNHIMWGTFEPIVDRGLLAISQVITENLMNKYDKEVKEFDKNVSWSGNKASSWLMATTIEILEHASNIIEDIRTESCDGELYIGREKDYNDLLEYMGTKQDKEFKRNKKLREAGHHTSINPAVSLLSFRFRRPNHINTDVISVERVKEIYDSCRLTSNRGGLKVLSDFASKELGVYIEKVFIEKLMNEKLMRQNVESCRINEEKYESMHNQLTKLTAQEENLRGKLDKDSQDKYKNVLKQIEELEKQKIVKLKNSLKSAQTTIKRNTLKIAAQKEQRENSDRQTSSKTSLKTIVRGVSKNGAYAPNEKQFDQSDKDNGYNIYHKPKEKLLGDNESRHALAKRIMNYNLKKEKEKTLKQIKELCAILIPENKSKRFDPSEANYNIDTALINAVRRNIVRIKQKERDVITDEGFDLLIDEYLNKIRQGNLNVFKNKETVEGCSLTLSIDCSGSMQGAPIKLCRNLVSTLFKATQPMKSIRTYGLLWAGSNHNADVALKEIKSLADCKYINTDGKYPLTPTPEAIRQTRLFLKKTKHKKKVLIFLTDGQPCRKDKHGADVSDEVLLKQTEKEMRLLQLTPNVSVIVLYVGTTQVPQYLKTAYDPMKKNTVYPVDDMNGVQKFVKEKLVQIIADQAK